ncbi:CDP-alcohol phosphatidyltransferase family protein [Methylobacter tundripaludum]|uniref:CDP-alcohol phosphatidyltransferase family protein n=1 Tax=Methylobacter tundripaludum TaxID=173365 RepID=UPI000691E987|nr:CDP-alcohol phosphatidyltransferase family protein [Methylobacter tundripaludum]
MKHELQVITALGCSILLIGFCLLVVTMDWGNAVQWLVQAGLLWGYICRYIGSRLELNRANAEAPLYNNLGWGNRLTILRGGLIALTGGFLFQNHDNALNVLLPASLYTLAAILDRLDGFVARRSKQVSLLGNHLDISFDALGLVVAPLLAIGLGKIHWTYLILSAAYYIYQWGLQRRRDLGLPVYALPPNPLRRTLAGFQMGFIAVALWPLLNPALTTSAGIAFMLPVLFGFVADWWVVCGSVQPQILSRLEIFSGRFFQPGLRALLVLLLFLATKDAGMTVHVFGLLLSTGLILLGFAGRLGALILIMLLGWHYPSEAIDFTGYVLIFTASWILLLGTGRFSLWQWDDEWVARYDGA